MSYFFIVQENLIFRGGCGIILVENEMRCIMYITLDILTKHGVGEDIYEYFTNKYPDGVEAMSVIKNSETPNRVLHWIYEWLDISKEEIEVYWQRVNVVDSEGVCKSNNVTRSALVVGSNEVSGSRHVYDSEQITDSHKVVSSQFINSSEYIVNSEFIDESHHIFGSKNVNGCSQVVDSVYIMLAHGVFESSNIVNAHSIWKSENLTDCYFCFNCHNVFNALFCEGISNGEYYLFNKKIDKARFDMILRQYKLYSTPFITLMSEWPEGFGQSPTKYYDYRKHTEKITDKFYAWVKTLPGYDPAIMYSITFDSRFLV